MIHRAGGYSRYRLARAALVSLGSRQLSLGTTSVTTFGLGKIGAHKVSQAAGKRLLVRLRHCEQIRMETGADAPIYHWVG